MAPLYDQIGPSMEKRFPYPQPSTRTEPPTRASMSINGGILEAWGQGYNVGSLVVLILIVFCNYRPGIMLHKLILLELVLALWHGTFIFASDPYYGWYLSATATLLFISYQLHNVVSWLKIRPFLPRWGSRFFIISLICVQPFWVAEAWSNFEYFNNLGSDVNTRMRPWEALLRDPWWIFTTWKLIDAIKKTYGFRLWALVKINTRFGVMLACMFISIAFLLTDVAVNAAHITANAGINPFWRFALVFKCASDTIFLDDFKSVLDDIVARKLSSAGGGRAHRPSYRGSRSHSYYRPRPKSPKSNGQEYRERSNSVYSTNTFRCDPGTIDESPSPSRASPTPGRPEPATTKPESRKWTNTFAFKGRGRGRDNSNVQMVQVQRDVTVDVTTEEQEEKSENTRDDSWGSERGILNQPKKAVYGHRRNNASTGSLSNYVNGSPV